MCSETLRQRALALHILAVKLTAGALISAADALERVLRVPLGRLCGGIGGGFVFGKRVGVSVAIVALHGFAVRRAAFGRRSGRSRVLSAGLPAFRRGAAPARIRQVFLLSAPFLRALAGRGLRSKVLKSYCLHFFFSLSYLMHFGLRHTHCAAVLRSISMPQHGHFIPARLLQRRPLRGRRMRHSRRRWEPSPPSARTSAPTPRRSPAGRECREFRARRRRCASFPP